jgi:hypothetical protein
MRGFHNYWQVYMPETEIVTARLRGGPRDGDDVQLPPDAAGGPPLVFLVPVFRPATALAGAEGAGPPDDVVLLAAEYRLRRWLRLGDGEVVADYECVHDPGGHVLPATMTGRRGNAYHSFTPSRAQSAPRAVDILDLGTGGLAAVPPPDRWSLEDKADTCWRCDAVKAASEVGLCLSCRDDLRA